MTDDSCATNRNIILAQKIFFVNTANKIIERLKKDIPHANISGGGHECAGAIKFTLAHLHEIIQNIKKQAEELNYEEENKREEEV